LVGGFSRLVVRFVYRPPGTTWKRTRTEDDPTPILVSARL
jgi:hypothetical protein